MMRAIACVAKGSGHHPSEHVTSNTRNTTTRWSCNETAARVERVAVLPRNEPKSSHDHHPAMSDKAKASATLVATAL
jgi:hypothetical protein